MLARHYHDVGGWRLCAVVRSGRRWARLLDLGNFRAYRVSIDAVDTIPLIAARRLARRLDAKRRQWNRLGVRYRTERDVKRIVAALRRIGDQ